MGTQEGTEELEPVEAPEDQAPPVDEAEVQETPPEESTDSPLSMEDAAEAARAILAEEQAPTEEPAPEPEETPPGEEKPPEPTPAQMPYSEAYRLWKSGRHSDVPADLRAHFQQVDADAANRAQVQAEQDREFRELYLGYLAMKEEDPAQFAELLMSQETTPTGTPKGQAIREFMAAYARAHPDVSLDNPDAPTNRRGDIAADARRQVFEAVDAGVAEFAKEAGLTDAELDQAFTDSKGNFSAFLKQATAAAIKKGVAAEVERLRPELEKENRQAATLEAQQKIVNGAPAAARRFASGSTSPRRPVPADDWTAALQRAKERVSS